VIWQVSLAGAGLIILPLALAWVSSGFRNLSTWPSFLLVAILGAGILLAGWRLLRREPRAPRWLAGLVVGAALLRLAIGAIWFVALPVAGYGTPSEQHGYVMSDAYDRDQTAWTLARSNKPLMRAFQGSYRKADQYGGMLFVSALVYRYSGASTHPPLLMVLLTAVFSALGIVFAWGFARSLWGETAAYLAAWGLALYPDAVLIGSSQMREAFSITLAIAAAYGLLLFGKEKVSYGAVLAAGCVLLSLPLSPPSAALLLLVLIILGLSMGQGLLPSGLTHRRWFWPALILLVVLVAAGLWLAWLQFAPAGVNTPLGVMRWWVKKSADWNAHLSERASGWVQKIFKSTPGWTHAPLLVLYGIVQPFLPAALGDTTGAPIWRLIAIWRSAGWTVLLAFLLYAPLRSLRKGYGLERALSLSVWLVILAASFRGGGDAWDNPRYRVAFAGLQLALAAWVWAEQRRQPDPNLRRVLVGVGLVLLWFVPWYLRRYVHLDWPISDVFRTLGLGMASAALFWIWDWAGRAKKGEGRIGAE
jgi:hypothetical protein